ncbi:PTS transporter subunit IIABC [[Clostridium] polysaccharolyticum]|uniref:PTS system IIA component, Glc family /PTS system IIB component, Glc family /PTS system IIC component, Glc family n=1 Tax=[Clostridium] polysaccharolyticum TaxID=29364 RepID=A0A1I0CJ39_9FIRM|nr:PTS transporter subunit IIABC [[Clostridium] polysaccharolyticum]SET19621.1 PTS system IIA component, Glc family /PTS system IIB component, Glc family /PTS system IIC component, Glc family [[Clostridium] polysaccharolyticum]
MRDKIFGVLQRVGRSFMLPIAILPVAGLFLGIGGSFTNQTMIEAYGLTKILGEGTLLYNFLLILNACGNIVFANLPILFAMGVAIGMAKKEKEVAALSAAIAYFIMHAAISVMIDIRNLADTLPSGSIADTVGISSLQMGVFGGIIVGLGVAALHNRFYKIALPQVVSFFGGSRFIPIISSIVYLFVGILMSFIWPAIQNGIYAVGDLVLRSGYAGTWVYGFMERALIPFGLHHVFYLPFWQTAVGGTAVVGGQLIEGAQNIFFAELADGTIQRFSVSATRFMSGKFPLMIFGLPGAALAMFQAAKPEKRKIVGGLVLSAALTSALTGITEPIEFTFLFVAPLLYIIHCVFAGLAYMFMHIFNVGVGMTFSGGLIDLTLFGILQGNAKTNWIWVVIVGIVYFFVYYGLFYFLITKLNYKTPGREDDNQEVKLYTRADVNSSKEEKKKGTNINQDVITSAMIVKGLGGAENISDVDCCATRLRCTVIDDKKVDQELLKQSGAAGVICKGKGVQVIYGPKVSVIKSNLEDYLDNPVQVDIESDAANNNETSDTANSSETIVLGCPIKGNVKSVTEAPDAAFSEKMMGDGIVIFPTDSVVYAPMDCEISFVFPSKHAIGLVTETGLEALIHVGLDTVKLEGQGFHVFVKDGDKVKRGDKLMEFDLEYIREHAADTATPFIITNLADNQSLSILKIGEVDVDTDIIEVK